MKRLALIALGLRLVACSGDDADARAESTFTPGEAISEVKTPPTVDEPPSGACANDGEQQIVRTPAGLAACRNDASFAAAEPNEWRCTCTQGAWHCEIIRGGFGTVACP